MTIFAGTSKGVFSIGDGASARVLESRGVRDLAAANGSLFAGTGAGLFRSQDDGITWAQVGLEDREVWQTRDAGGGVVYASTQPAGLFRSTDSGDTWSSVDSFGECPQAAEWCIPVKPQLPGRARALVVDSADANRLWVGVEVGGIMRTGNGGETWDFNLPGDNPDLHMMCAHPEHPEILFASTGYGRLDGIAEMVEGNAGVFRSEDSGETWEYAWHGMTPRYSRPMCIDPRAPFGLTVASAPNAFSSFKDEGGAQAMLFRSEDGGRSWRSLCDQAHSPSAQNIHGLTPDPDVPGGVLVGTDTGELWRVSNDATWTLLESELPPVLSIIAV